ncbi:MAG TPA: hypothetical protein VHO84_04785 [Syntrophorhabdaceae bacterium]|nr:hypothetical protein [Syntrophorhabdaceae bacterium]
MRKYLLYVFRWIVLAIPGALFFNQAKQLLGIDNVYVVMIISQGVMGAMVYFLDRLIFTSGAISIPWEVKPKGVCAQCGHVGKCFRINGKKCCDIQDKGELNGFICENCALRRIRRIDG